MHTHLATYVSRDFMTILKFHFEHRVAQCLENYAIYFYSCLFCHIDFFILIRWNPNIFVVLKLLSETWMQTVTVPRPMAAYASGASSFTDSEDAFSAMRIISSYLASPCTYIGSMPRASSASSIKSKVVSIRVSSCSKHMVCSK